jgi:hypothetical protein
LLTLPGNHDLAGEQNFLMQWAAASEIHSSQQHALRSKARCRFAILFLFPWRIRYLHNDDVHVRRLMKTFNLDRKALNETAYSIELLLCLNWLFVGFDQGTILSAFCRIFYLNKTLNSFRQPLKGEEHYAKSTDSLRWF